MSRVNVTPEFIQGAISIEQGDGYVQPWRTNHEERDLFPSINDGLLSKMSQPVGVRLRDHGPQCGGADSVEVDMRVRRK